MCYETSLTKGKVQIEFYSQASFQIPLEYEPYYHLNGFSHPNLQIIKIDEPEAIYPASWGVVPSWGVNDIVGFRKKYNTLNTKSETFFDGVSKDLTSKRCLILSDGFFEPHKSNGVSIPQFCFIPSSEYSDGRDLFCFAGVYSEIDKTANTYTCSILTLEANDFFSEVHNVKKRMPLVLDEELHNEWFNTHLSNDNLKELIKHSFTSKTFKSYPVSRDLYKRGIDTNKEYILQDVQKDTLF